MVQYLVTITRQDGWHISFFKSLYGDTINHSSVPIICDREKVLVEAIKSVLDASHPFYCSKQNSDKNANIFGRNATSPNHSALAARSISDLNKVKSE